MEIAPPSIKIDKVFFIRFCEDLCMDCVSFLAGLSNSGYCIVDFEQNTIVHDVPISSVRWLL